MTRVRVGVIGAGAMGTAHMRTLAAWVPGARVTAVYDADVARAKTVATEVGAAAAGSAEELVESAEVDAVLVAAPDPMHEELALACLGAGKPTLCEKPLATSVAGSERVVERELTLGRRLVQVGFMRRFDPAFGELRAVVAEGQLGMARVVHCVHRNPRAHPTATSDGVVFNSMIHELDHVPWLLGSPLVAITVVAPPVLTGPLLDTQVALLETASGVLATVEVSINARYGYDVQCEVVADRGTARLTPPYGLSVRREGVSGVQVSDDFVARFAEAYRVELASWVASVTNEVPTGPSAWDGHLANLAAAAGARSLHSGSRETIERPDVPALYG